MILENKRIQKYKYHGFSKKKKKRRLFNVSIWDYPMTRTVIECEPLKLWVHMTISSKLT